MMRLADLATRQTVEHYSPHDGRLLAVIVGGGETDRAAYLSRVCVAREKVFTSADLATRLGSETLVHEALTHLG